MVANYIMVSKIPVIVLFSIALFLKVDRGAAPEDLAGAHQRGQSVYRSSALRFLSSGTMLPLSMLLHNVMEPLCGLMHKTLKVSGEEWEQAECAKASKGLPRQTRVGLCSDMSAESDAMEKLSFMMSSETAWKVLPPLSRTVDVGPPSSGC